MSILLGLDIGTTKLCAVAIEVNSGQMLSVHSASANADLISEHDAFEQDVSAITATAFRLLGEVIGSLPNKHDISGLGVTGQMHGVLVSDQQAHAYTPLITWQDQRGNHMCDGSNLTYTQELHRRLGTYASCTGAQLATGYGGVTLFRLAQQGLVQPSSRAYTIQDYIVHLLTGANTTDPTNAASWGIADVQHQSGWLPEIDEICDLPSGILPTIAPTGSLAGYVRADMASACSLPVGLPVAVALGDNQASFIGSVPSFDSSVLFNMGTGGQVSCAVDRYQLCEGLDTRPLLPNYWLQVGSSLCGGSSFKILAAFLHQIGVGIFDTDLPISQLYSKMVEMALSQIDDDDLPVVHPYFNGTRTDALQSAEVIGLRSHNFTAGKIIKAFAYGMVDELLGYHKTMQSSSKPQHIAASGNGFRRNPILRDRLERAMGQTVVFPPNEEEAAVGAALSAGMALGVFTDWQQAGRVIYKMQGTA